MRLSQSNARSWAVVGFAIAGLASPARAQDEIYVTNNNNSVTVYPRAESGDKSPIRTIVGATNTGFSGVEKLSLDTLHQEIVVANNFADSVTTHDLTDVGDALPTRTIVGASTLLIGPDVPLVDFVHDEIFVTSSDTGGAVRVFSRIADGDKEPLRNLEGPETGLNDVQGLALDLVHDELFVANGSGGGHQILVFRRTSSGPTAPTRSIAGAETLLADAEGLVVDTVHDELFVANNGDSGPPGASITVYPRTASGPAEPIRRISGPKTGLTIPEDVALDLAHDELFVADESGAILVFRRLADGDEAPLRVLAGASTGLSQPQGIRVIPWIFADGFELGNPSRWVVSPL